jgi:hypothetical protein
MDRDIDDLLRQLREIEDELERRFEERRQAFAYEVERRRIVFENQVATRHRALRVSVARFLRTSPLLALLTAPVIYALIVPLAAMDLAASLYQWVCFPIWGMRRVRRGEFLVIDRHYLGYLNGIQKLNCVYCGYANGVIAYAREIAARTEQYWCPIKHARRVPAPHRRYRDFLDYGDGEGFSERLDDYRTRLRD